MVDYNKDGHIERVGVELETRQISIPRTRQKAQAPYYLLKPGENGAQLWERLHPCPVGVRNHEIWGFTLLTSGKDHARALVIIITKDGHYKVYRAVCVDKDKRRVVLEVE